ncbi:MFS transporter [Novosphingobium sp. SG720]|uniref:MFS transporter n=1 Tax=Novosphingobium sp. SG720 TaxID=2586998 RepID=UPI001447F1BF|nr:MFS transporter [Novosphingobium sp. SG720]NKJ44507.1 AAHS family 3-hydroxyphenylpropionic acid transporter [Novosphingobium sp. SG720]
MNEATAERSTWTMPLCFLVTVLEGYDLQIISSAGPVLQNVMNLSQAQIGVFLSATLIGLGIGAVIGGWAADWAGRKPVVIASIVALGLFTFGTALSTSYEMVVLTRILAGVGLGGAMPTLIATMAETSAAARTTSAVTTVIVGQPLGGILSGIVGRTLVVNYGWQSLFTVGGILTVLTIPLLIRYLPETLTKGRHRNGAKLASWQALFGGGRAGSTVLLWIAFILTLALLSVLLGWTPLLVRGMGYPVRLGIDAIIAINLGGVAGGLCASRMIDRLGVRGPMLVLYALIVVGLIVLSQAKSPSGVMVAAFLVGIGTLGGQFTLYGIAPRLYPRAGRGAGVGTAVALGRFGSVFAPVIVGLALGQGAGAASAIVTMIPVAVIAGLALYGLSIVGAGALGRQEAEDG